MAYNPDEEPTRQIRFRPGGMPNQPAPMQPSGTPPHHDSSNPTEPDLAGAAPWQDYPPQPYDGYAPSAPPRPPMPMADRDNAPPYPAYSYPPSAPAQQPGGYPYAPASPKGRKAINIRLPANVQRFWHALTLSGQAAGIAGVFMLIFFSLPWLYTPNFRANLSGKTTIPTVTHSGWGTAAGAQLFSNLPALNLFPHLWLVVLCALALITLAVLAGLHHISLRSVALLLPIISLAALLMEFFFLLQVSALGSALRIGLSATSNQTLYGASWGFWLTVITTIAALGVGIYLALETFAPETFRKPRAPGVPGNPGQYPTPTA